MTNTIKAATDTIIELFVIYTLIVIVAAITFSIAESKSIGDSLYWAGITATSVGYGDVTPATTLGRITGVLLAHVSIFLIAPLIVAKIVMSIVENHHEFTDDEQRYLLTTIKDIHQKAYPERYQAPLQQSQQMPIGDPETSQRAHPDHSYFKPKLKG